MAFGRRMFIGSLIGAAVLGAAWFESRPDPVPPANRRFTFLRDADRALLAVLAPVLVGRADAARFVVPNVDVAIAGLPLETRKQLRTLFDLLTSPAGRIGVAGIFTPWHLARPQDVSAFLQRWRTSWFVQLRSAYDALHQLVLAAYYSANETWPSIGYPGPPSL